MKLSFTILLSAAVAAVLPGFVSAEAEVLAPPPSPPPCPASVVTRDDCVAYCKEQPGAKRHGVQVKPPAGGVGNISECYCTVKTTPPTDYSCSRTPTPLPPIPASRGTCKTEGITDSRSCVKFCNSHRRPQGISTRSANGLIKCECKDGFGKKNPVVWSCSESRGQDSYLRSG